jgi:hypothetical protein
MTCRGLRGAAGATTSAGGWVFGEETTLRSLLGRIGPHSPLQYQVDWGAVERQIAIEGPTVGDWWVGIVGEDDAHQHPSSLASVLDDALLAPVTLQHQKLSRQSMGESNVAG